MKRLLTLILYKKMKTELTTQYDSRKSFYKKAMVESENGILTLISYNTRVAKIENGEAVVYGSYSRTTIRHITEFLKQNGFIAVSQAQILTDYSLKDEIIIKSEPIND